MPKLRETIVVPPLADSAEYVVLVKLSDELAKATAEKRAIFHLKGRDVAPSDTLVVRNFRFLRGEDDGKPLPVAAYRPGDSVWARFEMTGYKLGDKNQVDIEYGLTVLREDGSVAYTEPQAANQKIQSLLSTTLSAWRAQPESRERSASSENTPLCWPSTTIWASKIRTKLARRFPSNRQSARSEPHAQ